MAEIRRGFGGDEPAHNRLPWLEPVEDEDDYPDPRGSGRIAVWLIAGLAVTVLLFGAFVLWQRYRASHADIGTVIKAPPGPYKVKPTNPGGLAVSEQDVIASRMGTGNDINSPIDLSRLPEQPVASPSRAEPQPPAPQGAVPASSSVAVHAPKPAAAAPVPTSASAPVVKAPPAAPVTKPAVPAPAPTAAPASGGGTIQLGALGSEAKAKEVWKSLSSRFGVLAPLSMSITPVKVGDSTLYRLRASGGNARRVCAQLKVAGESCNVVD